MADPVSQTDSSNFENDFEKLDPLVPLTDDLVSSSSQQAEDLFSASGLLSAESAPAKPIINLDDLDPLKAPTSEPAFQPDSSSPAKEPTPPPAPAPAKAEPTKKPQVSTGEEISWLPIRAY